MQKIGYSIVLGAALLLIGAGCSSTPSTTTQTSSTNTQIETDSNTAGSATTSLVDYTSGQSTGAQTESVEGTEKGLEYRNTLIDREIGVAVTCPGDKTWRCTLDSQGMFQIQDMSSNVFSIRVVTGVTNTENALNKEIAYLQSTLPGVSTDSSGNGEAILTVGPDPSWATQVNRKAWVGIKEINGKFFACHGIGSEGNFENDSPDYKSLCDSLKAPAAK